MTLGGHTCLQWNAAEVQALIKGKDFLPQVQLVKNNCRNPDGDMEGPWCYVKEPSGIITIDYCDFELCGEYYPSCLNKTYLYIVINHIFPQSKVLQSVIVILFKIILGC